MRDRLSSLSGLYRRAGRMLLVLSVLSVWSFASENTERIFSRQRNLVAVARCSNLELVNKKIATLFERINPDNPFKKPLLDLRGPVIYNDALLQIKREHWVEAVLLSLPLEKDNDWVYVLRVNSQKQYLKAILGFGNIRQELQEEGITRYRQTFEDSFNVFYVSFTADNLILLSRSRIALDLTRKLYAFSSREGLLGSTTQDMAFVFHFNRYLAGNPRFLAAINMELNRDILRELAGSQAKKDNPLNLGLIHLLKGMSRLLQEVAVVEMSADFQKDNLEFDIELLPSYGGNVHYALSNLPEKKIAVADYLPPQATEVCEGKIWKEASEQIIDGIGATVAAMLGREVTPQIRNGAQDAMALFSKASPSEYAMGLVVPENAAKRCGPLWVGLLKWDDSAALRDGWKTWLDFFTVGELAEMLAEKGLRLEISREDLRVPENPDLSSQVRIKLSSLYFKLPGIWGEDQRIMLSLQGDTLVIVAPAAPLDSAQYAEAYIFMQQTLRDVVTAISAGKVTRSKPVLALRKDMTPRSILTFAAHPLRYVQHAFLAESVWPQENTPNRLPVPWEEYYKEFKLFPLLGLDAVAGVRSVGEGLHFKFHMPAKTLVETVRACLDIKIAGKPEGRVTAAGVRP